MYLNVCMYYITITRIKIYFSLFVIYENLNFKRNVILIIFNKMSIYYLYLCYPREFGELKTE